MNIDYRIKKAIMRTALTPLLSQQDRNIHRTTRNIMELGLSLRIKSMSMEEYDRLSKELTLLIWNTDKETILDWMLAHF